MQGRTVLITGGNSGIGKATAVDLARQGARVVIACRGSDKTERALREIGARSGRDDVRALPLDLASFTSIHACAEKFRADHEHLDVLINNAGVFPRQQILTEEGFEAQFGVNHLGHFLLTHLLLDLLRRSAPARVVTVASMMHAMGKIDFGSFRGEKPYGAYRAYGQSKLANILFSNELAKRSRDDGVVANALHPGSISTDITRDQDRLTRFFSRAFFSPPEKGASTSVYLASSGELEDETGGYFVNCRPRRPWRSARDESLAARLWQESAALCGVGG
jgi:NAD(P)-dependent dehydrogenase (short-subunit alcohol dehydrogenase family)